MELPKLVHVQSVLEKDTIIALKIKTKETSIKEAIYKAISEYLKDVPDTPKPKSRA